LCGPARLTLYDIVKAANTVGIRKHIRIANQLIDYLLMRPPVVPEAAEGRDDKANDRIGRRSLALFFEGQRGG
jgi:hypothetical protein